ncbi:MAG: HPr family phosphocarrier protein [Butyricicoccus sp.]|nr:HPr family phosphocarrier protein [Clostridiales bacterium]
MTKAIKVKNSEDIQTINSIVTEFPFDIWIHGKSGMVDAKSLLGMFLLSLNEPLELVIEDDEDPKEVKKLFKALANYLDIED